MNSGFWKVSVEAFHAAKRATIPLIDWSGASFAGMLLDAMPLHVAIEKATNTLNTLRAIELEANERQEPSEQETGS